MFADWRKRARDAYGTLGRGGRLALVVLIVLYLGALLAPAISPYSPSEQPDIVNLKNLPPTLAHPFGTDRFSRDVFSRVLHGARISLSVATLAVLLSAIIGTFYGLVAAMSGQVVDTLMMRLLDAFLAIPRILLLMAVVALWTNVSPVLLVALLGLTGWFAVSRLVRAEALTVREREFVVAARSLGAGRARIIVRHLLPNVLAPVIVTTTLNVGNVIVLEAGLSFLGIGAREPTASLGTMLRDGTEALAGTWWTAFFPGLLIVLTVLCFNVLGDALRAFLDPRQLPSVRLGTGAATLPAAPMVSR